MALSYMIMALICGALAAIATAIAGGGVLAVVLAYLIAGQIGMLAMIGVTLLRHRV